MADGFHFIDEINERHDLKPTTCNQIEHDTNSQSLQCHRARLPWHTAPPNPSNGCNANKQLQDHNFIFRTARESLKAGQLKKNYTQWMNAVIVRKQSLSEICTTCSIFLTHFLNKIATCNTFNWRFTWAREATATVWCLPANFRLQTGFGFLQWQVFFCHQHSQRSKLRRQLTNLTATGVFSRGLGDLVKFSSSDFLMLWQKTSFKVFNS